VAVIADAAKIPGLPTSNRGFGERTFGIAVDDEHVYFTTWPKCPNGPQGTFTFEDAVLCSTEGGRIFSLKKADLQAGVPAVIDSTDVEAGAPYKDAGPFADGGPFYHTTSMPSYLAVVNSRLVWNTWYGGGGIRSRAILSGGLGLRNEDRPCESGPYGCGYRRLAGAGSDLFAARGDTFILAVRPGANTGAQTVISNISGSQPGLLGVAAASERVYWTTTTAVRSIPRTGFTDAGTSASVIEHVVLGAGDLDAIVVDETFIYYTNRGTPANGGTLQRVKKAGGPPETLAIDLGVTASIAIDKTAVNKTTVYVVGTSAGAIYGVDVTALPPSTTVLVKSLRYPEDIAVDSAAIYFTGGDDGKVYRLEK